MLTLLRLCRFPAVFTALGDVVAGLLLTQATPELSHQVWWLLAASAGLYLSGMVFNDLFDVDQDRRERSQRPIPSGAISPSGALIFGTSLMGVGIASSAVAGVTSLCVALLLSGCILAYDGWLKKTRLGPVAMGGCRFLNILLGASGGVESFSEIWSMPQMWAAAAMGVYILGVTQFARTEAKTSDQRTLLIALFVLNVGLLMFPLWFLDLTSSLGLNVGRGAATPLSVTLLWGIIALTINRRAFAAIVEPTPEHVQTAIRLMLLSILVLDAMMIYFQHSNSGLAWVVGVLLLLIPAVFLKKLVSLT